jgi:predicted glutamine amidotransferase
MCMIIVKPKGARIPKKKNLKYCYENNSDGIGLAYTLKDNKNVHIKKDFKDFNDFHTFLCKNIKKEDLAVIHFRFATSGLVDNGNNHPFPISNNLKRLRQVNLICQKAIAHNGVISKFSGHNKYSDTQKFIYNVIGNVNFKENLKDVKIKKRIKSIIGKDRLAIIDKGELILFGDYTEYKNCLYSNYNFMPVKYEKVNYKKDGYDYSKYTYCECAFCGKYREVEEIKGFYLCQKCASYML